MLCPWRLLQCFPQTYTLCVAGLPVGYIYRFTFTALHVCCVKPSVDFHIGLNENANSLFATRCPFAAVKIAVSPVTAVHKAALHSQMLLYEMEMKSTNRTNHRRLASHKGGFLKNESLSESFGSRWASKVITNAYYKTMKVFFNIACMSTCCWGLPKPKYEPFITHNRGTLLTFL